MNTRRSFIKTVSTGTALSTLTFSTVGATASRLISENLSGEKPIRIGIIGAENSHTVGYGKLFNIDKKFPGVELKYVWGETEEFAKESMTKGQIPYMVKDPLEMLGKIDALIVDHRHAKYHLKAAEPFVKAGIPTFIDKPFCYTVAEGKEFLEMAREAGTPVSSYSTIAHTDSTFDIVDQIKSLGEFNNIIRNGPADIESPYGGIFFYGVHLVQPLMYMFGEDIKVVKINKYGKKAGAVLIFESGLQANLVFNTLHYGWETYVETKKGIVELKSRVQESVPERCYRDMVEMFRTGKEPLSHESILKPIAVLEAMEKSVSSEKWEEVKM
ncbi:Gfo/Idh/MocA family protein [Aquipluma nitroreducens]|uniref:Gfo/Idh/MocA family protein n=1 Tax=Aquipluma nitroreducens TaxID=2010828 RepID=UPI00296F8F8F|nr:Gfo/Idh/MocA family oxidoreductase [Aquipluma nitroreducens]